MTWLAGGLSAALLFSGVAGASEPASTIPTSPRVLVMLRLPAEHFSASGGYGAGYGAAAGRAARRRTADRLAAAYGLKVASGWPMPLVGVECFVMDVAGGQSATEAADRISRDRRVAWSEPVEDFRTRAMEPNDPMFRMQPAASAWRLADLRATATGRGVTVAVVDSGVDARHPDLVGQVVIRRNFVAGRPDAVEAHGTEVAGVIAARADNGVGIAGVAPGARLMGLRACWQDAPSGSATCDTLSLAKAMSFAIDGGAQVLNLSLSGPPTTLLGKLIDVARAHGAVVVGAVDPNLPQGGFPAAYPGVIAAAQVVQAGIDAMLAPGRDVPTTAPGGRWELVSGNSFSAAHVSGLVALMLEHAPRGAHTAGRIVLGLDGAIDACASLRACATPLRTVVSTRR